MLIDVIKESREIFGKREIEIVDKQINGISLTQSEKNVLSRSIRKKLELVKKLSKYSDEFNLKFNAENNKIINDSMNIIKSKINLKAILLFGSLLKKDNTKFSDIDLCIVLGRNVTKKQSTEILLEISGRLNKKIDISIYENLPDNIKCEILKNNRILYKTDDFNKTKFEIKELKIKNGKKII
jgi:predicted nucleotidyltransferase